ncbi:murein transglycosylase [Rhodospirillaceae bacterium RKSG073]|nr:murein transglycosylase [Curvivirga aplysinae]
MADQSPDKQNSMSRRNPKGPALFAGVVIGLALGILATSFVAPHFLKPEEKIKIVIQEKEIIKEVIKEVPVPVKEPEAKPEEVKKPEGPAIKLTKASFSDLPGWLNDDFAGIEQALKRSCSAIQKRPADKEMGRGHDAIPMTYGDWQPICGRFSESPELVAGKSSQLMREFLEKELAPYLAANNEEVFGKFTGYFEAELKGSRVKTDVFKYPLYGKPNDLVSVNLGDFSEDLKGKHVIGRVDEGQKFKPYHQRGAIEAGGLDPQGLELLWINDPVDVFLLQVQGSGRVILPDGGVVRVGYAAHNGHKYRSIGRYLIEQGEIEKHKASWGGIRNWIEQNPDKQADLFAQNPRFVFFRELDGDGPIGSQGVALTPKRSMAVDQRFIPLGNLIWLDTVQPGGSTDPLQTLMVAQDTGGAIKGPVRGDFFWGYGDKALAKAGRMNSKGQYFVLIPNSVAERLSSKIEETASEETSVPN